MTTTIRRFAICAGHDQRDPGNTAGGHREADLMLELRDLLSESLRARGCEVVNDGPTGANRPLIEAVTLVRNVDLAVELHTNAGANPQATGVEIISLFPMRAQAQALARAIANVLSIPLRRDAGWYDGTLHGMDRGWSRPAAFVRAGGLIVETFFQSNPQELARYLVRRDALIEALTNVLVPMSDGSAP